MATNKQTLHITIAYILTIASSALGDSTTLPPAPCTSLQPLDLPDVVFLNDSHLLLPDYDNETIHVTTTELTSDICFDRSDALKAAILHRCQKWRYDDDEYERLDNGSIAIDGRMLEPGTYEMQGGFLWMCEGPSEEDGGGHQIISQESFVSVGKVGSWVSIVALSAHLLVFSMVPALKNLPGYHLAALSVAFLFGYSFSLIGQIPEVLGAECVAAGILQQFFFLAAFFCMNVMAVDIFRSLRLATRKLAVKGHSDRRRQFALYMLYAWGSPLLITVPCALLDHLDGVPDWLRPRYGSQDICWMGNEVVKAVFFWAPSFVLFAANSILFVASALTVYRHSFKGEQGRVTFVLYLRLGVMMGLTWLMGAVAALVNQRWLWFAFDLCNSLQGLFICLLFFCSKRVRNRIVERWREASPTPPAGKSDKQSSNGTNVSEPSKSSVGYLPK